MTINDSVLQKSEKIIFALRGLYLSAGYQPYRMSKFEEYDLYAGNKDFLLSDNVITFTDIGGKLMALKPDVTLSIIKNSTDAPDETRKVFYNENVYRVSKGTGSFKEIMQAGVECFGAVGESEICEVLRLAAESLSVLSNDAVLTVSDLGILSSVIGRLALPADRQNALYAAIGEKNTDVLSALCAESADGEAAALLGRLLRLHGPAADVLPELDGLLGGCAAYGAFRGVIASLLASDVGAPVQIDFSVTGDTNYYNGIIFKGFLSGIPSEVLSGGQYDRLMRRLGRRSAAIGFAVYTDALDRLDLPGEGERKPDGFVNVALPKGRLGEKIYAMFAKAGFECPSILEPNRKLIFENPERGVRYFWVKPSDVAIYVEHGAADIGVAGKDILAEYEPDVYELLDLKKGKCKMAVAAPKGFSDDTSRTLRVATKFANIAKNYYRAKGRIIDIIHLNGSIEIAPILGLSDVIVDIVETGATLRENDLEVIDDVLPISARLIANKSSYKFKDEAIGKITEALKGVTEADK
ncbi:MAG: ATP phosphoribosyltransferase [Clostridia bacterium]|nr:ATP phosphoribosyltransferase [Clostridia bacterium]